MSDAARFLGAFAQALATMTLYADGHPSRERAMDAAYRELVDLQAGTPQPSYTFLGDEVLYGRLPLRELKSWDWGQRLAQAGVQRLEFEAQVGREEFAAFVEEVLARLTLATIDTSEARQMRRSSIRMGAVGIRGETEPAVPLPTATISLSLGDEADTVRYLQTEVHHRGTIPLLEAEAVIHSLSAAMHSDQGIVLPLLQLKEFDQYTTTHSLNVAVLSMALAEHLGLAGVDVRAFGVAGLLHDIGKTRIPLDVLTKPGKFTEEERALMNRHPAEGARIIFEADQALDLAAVVAYEHHIMLNGGGYPALRFGRDCHRASKLVHVCDVYDALRTNRPYRDAWPQDKVLSYLEERAGSEFDAELARPFIELMRRHERQVVVLESDPAAGGSP